MSMRNLMTGVAIASAFTLAACGHSTGDRALSGAGIGAAGGAVIGAMTGTPATGAAIGAAAGAAIGAATDSCDLNLGDPYWKDRGRRAYERECGRR